MTFGPILASHIHPITTCRLLTFLHGGRVVFTDRTEMQTTKANKPEFTIKLEEFRERLRRKRYIDNAIEDVRAAFPCCRLPDLHCSRYMRGSRRLGRLQRLPTHISRASSQWRLYYRNWTT